MLRTTHTRMCARCVVGCVAKMHLMRTFCWCKKAFDAKQNVTNTFWLCKNAFDAYILFCKINFCTDKMLQMHLMRTFCWCKNAFGAKMHFGCAKNAFLHHIFQRKMFSKTKCYKCIWCYPLHFVLQKWQNVRKRQNAFWRTFFKGKCSAYIWLCKMWCKTKCYKCIWCQNAFWLCKNAFDAKMHFPMRTFCWCKNAFDAKMHLMRTFCNTKCYKCIWCYPYILFTKC